MTAIAHDHPETDMRVRLSVNPSHQFRRYGRARRRRGSTYILVLSTSMLVAIIGLTGVLMSRIKLRTSIAAYDMAEARINAITAIDNGLQMIVNDSVVERANFQAGLLPTDVPASRGTFSLEAEDLVDGNIANNTTDPILLRGIGMKDDAVHIVSVIIEFTNGEADFQPGTWQQEVR